MKKTNGSAIFFIIISTIMSFVMFCIITDKRISKSTNKQFIYYLSKIATIKNIVKSNHQLKLFNNFDSSGEINYLATNYRKLLKVITEEGRCAQGYRQCGILDTLGNILCIDEYFECPMNHIVIDLISKKSSYLSKNYKEVSYQNLNYNYQLYFSNDIITNNVTVSLKRGTIRPKYITMNNFVLDTNSYIEEYGNIGTFGIDVEEKFNNYSKTYDGSEISKNILNTALAENKLEKAVDTLFSLFPYISNKYIEKFIAYAEEQLDKEENNDDIYYQNIGEDVFIKSYIGFGSIEDIDKFLSFDFNIYKDIFPTRNTSITTIVFIFCDIIFFFVFIYLEDTFSGNNNTKEKDKKGKEEKKDNKNETEEKSEVEIKSNPNINKSERIDIKENDKNENNKNEKQQEKSKNYTESKNTKKDDDCDNIGKNICLTLFDTLFLGMNLGILIYACIIYKKVNKNENLDELKSIVADEFIKNFINEFVSKCEKSNLILGTIITLSITIGLNLLGIICLYL